MCKDCEWTVNIGSGYHIIEQCDCENKRWEKVQFSSIGLSQELLQGNFYRCTKCDALQQARKLH